MREGRVLECIAAVLAAENEDQLRERLHQAILALEGDQACFRIQVLRPPLEPVQHLIRCASDGSEPGWGDPPPEIIPPSNRKALPQAWGPGPAVLGAGEVPAGARARPQDGAWVAAHHSPGTDSVLRFTRPAAPRPGAAADRRLAHALQLLAGVLHVSTLRLVVPRLIARMAPRLTARETTCLRWVAQGKSDGVVATILGVSDSAVHFHMTNVLRKLGVSSRTQAVAKAIALGLIP